MVYNGTLRKMRTELLDGKVNYWLRVGDEEVALNDLVGKGIRLTYMDKIICLDCGATTKKSFAQGFCYKCFVSSPLTEECVLRPELCRAHEGVARDMKYAEGHCLIDHHVYLAVSSGVKVGVTRHTQIPTRWIDQGASYAIKLATVPNRHMAGLIEVALKEHMSDKTNWQRMLKNLVLEGVDLVEEKERAYELIPMELQEFFSDDDDITAIEYPVERYPEKVKSVSFDKQKVVEGRLVGIKGQYLIFEDNSVINIRKHGGYVVEVEVEEL